LIEYLRKNSEQEERLIAIFNDNISKICFTLRVERKEFEEALENITYGDVHRQKIDETEVPMGFTQAHAQDVRFAQ